jgi:hypothetical protein
MSIAPILKLTTELLIEIINYLPIPRFPRDRRTQFRDLAFMSKRFRDIAMPLLYNNVCLWVPHADRLIATLVAKSDLALQIKSLDLELHHTGVFEEPKVLGPSPLNNLTLNTCAGIAQASFLSQAAQVVMKRDLTRGDLVAFITLLLVLLPKLECLLLGTLGHTEINSVVSHVFSRPTRREMNDIAVARSKLLNSQSQCSEVTPMYSCMQGPRYLSETFTHLAPNLTHLELPNYTGLVTQLHAYTALTHLTLPIEALIDPSGGPCATPDYADLPPNVRRLSTGTPENVDDVLEILLFSVFCGWPGLQHMDVYIEGDDPREDVAPWIYTQTRGVLDDLKQEGIRLAVEEYEEYRREEEEEKGVKREARHRERRRGGMIARRKMGMI